MDSRCHDNLGATGRPQGRELRNALNPRLRMLERNRKSVNFDELFHQRFAQHSFQRSFENSGLEENTIWNDRIDFLGSG